MAALIILLTPSVRKILVETKLEIVQVFGDERIVVNDKIAAEGDSAYVTGEAEDFRKLAEADGGLWTSTNPMLGNWQQYLSAEAVS